MRSSVIIKKWIRKHGLVNVLSVTQNFIWYTNGPNDIPIGFPYKLGSDEDVREMMLGGLTELCFKRPSLRLKVLISVIKDIEE